MVSTQICRRFQWAFLPCSDAGLSAAEQPVVSAQLISVAAETWLLELDFLAKAGCSSRSPALLLHTGYNRYSSGIVLVVADADFAQLADQRFHNERRLRLILRIRLLERFM